MSFFVILYFHLSKSSCSNTNALDEATVPGPRCPWQVACCRRPKETFGRVWAVSEAVHGTIIAQLESFVLVGRVGQVGQVLGRVGLVGRVGFCGSRWTRPRRPKRMSVRGRVG